MSIKEQQKQLGQGVLFLIDNAGDCPPDMPTREFTDQKIAEHLANHSYYYHLPGKSGAENRRLVTASYLRTAFMKNLCNKGKHTAAFRREYEGEYHADIVFRVGSEGLSEKWLRMWEYDRATFKEDRLPKTRRY